MLDEIKFVKDWFAEVQDKGAPGRVRQVAFRKGAKLRAEIRLVDGGHEQSADLRLADGTTALGVPLASITVVAKKSLAA